MNPYYPQVAARALHRCEYCRAPEAMFNFHFEVEHIIPTSQGGEDQESNLALSCRSCNLFKGTHIHVVDPETGITIDLFNPRLDFWEQHFNVNLETGVIAGETSRGIATLTRLNMNSEAQIAARHQWMRLGLFP